MNNQFNFDTSMGLREHIQETLDFYYPNAIDEEYGGYHEGFNMDGTLTADNTKHIVGQSRHLYNFSIGVKLDGPEAYRSAAEHGVAFLSQQLRDQEYGGYYTQMKEGEVINSNKLTYGHAFIFRAAVAAADAGIDGAEELMTDVYQVLEERFYEAAYHLYKDEAVRDWSAFLDYRGQNCNMHICEALITAYEMTGTQKYLDQALKLAEQITLELPKQSGGLIWENYDQSWTKDELFNEGNTRDEFRAYGHIIGHQFEWSKLLTWLSFYSDEKWLLNRAAELYEVAREKGLDKQDGGIYFALSPQQEVIDRGKSYWVLAETITAAALLHKQTGEAGYHAHYQQLFTYVQQHFIDPKNGGWYQWLTEENKIDGAVKSPSPKTDYHPIAASYLIMAKQ